VLLEEETGRAKIADFGLARSFADEAATTPGARPFDDLVLMPKDPTLTATGAVPGTPSYMAPELLRGVEPSPTADIFAFGVIAYEILHEERPFAGPLWELEEPRPPSSGWADSLGLSAASTVERCLSFDPRERPSASELRAVLAVCVVSSS
jgi:serine/threonine protein kinase